MYFGSQDEFVCSFSKLTPRICIKLLKNYAEHVESIGILNTFFLQNSIASGDTSFRDIFFLKL